MQKNPDTITRYSVIQSLTEIGLGSVLHGLRIPFGGHVLSMNQSLILTFATRQAPGRRLAVSHTSGISVITALLKSLSPLGNRLGPMMAISTQGLLFASGVGVLGRNVVGIATGAGLLSLWAFAQPLLTAYVFFGADFFGALQQLWTKLAGVLGVDVSQGLRIILVVIAVKGVLTVSVSVLAWVFGERFEKNYLERLERVRAQTELSAHKSTKSKSRSSFLLNPLFLLSLALSIGFFIFSRDPEVTEVLFYLARILGVGFLLLFGVPWVIRRLPVESFPRLQAVADQVARARSGS